MSDPTDNDTSTTDTEEHEGQEPQSTEDQTPETPEGNPPDEGSGEGDEPNPLDELPEWARKELTKVRGEAANYRTRLRDAETRLSEAKTPEEFEQALADVREKNAELERSIAVANVARKYELPDDLAEELNYLPAEKVEERAKVLAKYLNPAPPESLGGGLDPTDDDDGEMDPRKLARRTRRR